MRENKAHMGAKKYAEEIIQRNKRKREAYLQVLDTVVTEMTGSKRNIEEMLPCIREMRICGIDMQVFGVIVNEGIGTPSKAPVFTNEGDCEDLWE